MQYMYSSSIMSISTSLFFNYNCNYFDERCSSTTSCACSCSFPVNSAILLHINPNFVYGLSKSTLIQFSPSRSLINDANWSSCDESCIRERNWGETRANCCKDPCFYRNRGGSRVNCRDSEGEDAENVINLLSERVSEKCWDVRERKRRCSKRGKVAHREDVLKGRSKGEKASIAFECVKSHRKHEGEMKEEYMGKEEGRGSRRGESSSSCYSLDLGDFEVDEKHEQLVGGSSSRRKRDSRSESSGNVSREEAMEDLRRYREEREEHSLSDKRESVKVERGKKSEECFEESESRKNSIINQSRESSYVKGFSSNTHSNYVQNVPTSDANFREGSRSHIQLENQIDKYQNSGVKHEDEMDIHGHSFDTTSSSQRRLTGREENLAVVGKLIQEVEDDFCKSCGRVSRAERFQSRTQQLVEGLKKEDEHSASFQTSVMDENGELSEATSDSNLQKGSGLDKQTRTKNSEENSSLLISSEEASRRCSVDGQHIRLAESGKALQGAICTSAIHLSETAQVKNSQAKSDKRIYDERTYMTSEKHKQVDERVAQTEVKTDVQTPIQPSEVLISQHGDQEVSEKVHRDTQHPIMPPSSKLIGGSFYVEPATKFVRQDSSIIPEGELFEKMRHEASTSAVQIEKKQPEIESVGHGEKRLQRGSPKSDSQSTTSKKQDSRGSSEGSGTKGCSDEFWDVKDQTAQESSKNEASVCSTISGDAVVRKTRKSFWRIVAGIFRLRDGARDDIQKFPAKSASGQISGNEPCETNGDNIRTNLTKDPTSVDPSLIRTILESEPEKIRVSSLSDKLRSNEVGAPPSSRVLESTALSGDTSMDTNTGCNVDQRSPLMPPEKQIQSHVMEEISGGYEMQATGSGAGNQKDESVNLRLTGTSGVEGEDENPKRQKFQHNEQIPKERFHAWEETYRHESELRRIDEMFMREALEEAKKAADCWEVPIGAVLVQDGKIIARGYNLVEELRDSTAHAEMICIREASNVLHSWRLSGTTLYVTLEPCPMCAGAILQARIDTLVWGARNKLLGADGSWIRLLPNGGDSLESTDKAPAPIHPFHPKMIIRRGILEADCAKVMQQFFQLRRKKGKKPKPKSRASKLLHKVHDVFHLTFCL